MFVELNRDFAMTKKELLRVIEQAARENAKELDLRNQGLTELPPEIGQREDIDLYAAIRNNLPRLASILKDMNTLTAEIHQESGFADLIKAVEAKLRE